MRAIFLTSSSQRVLPIPASPLTMRARRDPARASSSTARALASSASRPTSRGGSSPRGAWAGVLAPPPLSALTTSARNASRLAYVEVLPDEKGITVAAFLRRATAWYAERGIKVRRVMTDNGSGYVSKVFAGTCRSLAQRHLRTRAYRPQTNGKAERMVQTLLREWAYAQEYPHSRIRTAALRAWLRYYNEHRPHGALNSLPPISRQPSAA